jgi:broad specificity phosphatase PhoE
MPSSSLRLLLLRHGLTDWNETGRLLGRIEVGLNQRGIAQAEAAAEALRNCPLHAVLSSPQRRTQETAAPLATSHGISVQTEPALDEVWLGRWQGKTLDEISEDPDLHRYIEDPTYVCDAIEPTPQVQGRVVALVERLRAEATGQTVALVSHGDPLRALLAHYLSIDLHLFRCLTVAPGSVSVLKVGSRGSRLLTLNWKPGVLKEVLS